MKRKRGKKQKKITGKDKREERIEDDKRKE